MSAIARMATLYGSSRNIFLCRSASSHMPLALARAVSTESSSVATRLNSSGLLKSQALIGGKWVDAHDGNTIEVCNPATGEVITDVPCMGKKETNDAIASASNAFHCKMGLMLGRRYKLSLVSVIRTPSLRCNRSEAKLELVLPNAELGMLRPASHYGLTKFDLLMIHKEELGQLMTLEQGKPLKEAIGEVSYGAGFIEFFAEEAKRVYGDIIPATLPDRRLFVLKQKDGFLLQPVGVVGAVTPWNFPLAMITRKVGPALACGCTVVIKPSELTPLTALAAAELSLQAGIPPGVVNVVMGNAADIGEALLESPQVRKITFTGSTAVGKKLMAGSAATVKKVSLELGGNAPCIIFDDADLDVAVRGTLGTKFRNSGQTCVCANRVLVQEGIYDKFAEVFSNAVQNMKVGDGFGEGVVQVESLMQDAISKGAKILVGGKRHSLGMTFYQPTVLADVKSEMLLSREEIFGPVAPLLKFKTEEEAIQLANDTNAGLAAYIFTSNIQRSWRVTEALEYGIVGINEGVVSTEVAPFGGMKQSGLGREGSKYGMDEYLEVHEIRMPGKYELIKPRLECAMQSCVKSSSHIKLPGPILKPP
nr:succinate-semialdehyde dehydrogenase, mitochondrial isoform X1 [Ipomoea batatas]